jgi:tRNA A-37 threonylcarbamoyl transferase component Bud32/tetratricopeptide (TPR) repeat protein
LHIVQIPETEIIVSRDGAELLRKTLRPGDYVIGREPECEVQVEADLVSRRHAQLTVNFDHVLVEDLGSSNGTFINGKSVTEPTRLWPNQKIQVGAATVELRRIKATLSPEMTLAPQTAAVQQLLPEEFLREKKYDIGAVVAQGGMGAILEAKDATTERRVAMKVMLDGSDAAALGRFVTEARVTAQLEHPSIVPIYELSVDENGQPFYTMKMVRGITLRKVLELLAEGVAATVQKYPLPALLTIFQKVCDALAFAHAKGVLHRDLKPENIMLDDFGVVLVMDWGLAKVLGKTETTGGETGRSFVMSARTTLADSGRTMSGTIMGTPQYMAPEQARGEVETLDARADIYALGAILFHILHLRPSVTGGDAMEIVGKVERGEIAWDAKRQARIPDSLLAVCRKALALERERRYARVEDLQADILAYQNGFATSAEQAGAGKQFALFVRRNKAASLGVAAVLVVGGVLGAKAIIEGRRAEREAAAAKATLADLHRTAPVFYSQAKVDFEEGNFDDAVEKVGYAIQLDDTAADYHLFLANLRESSQDLAAAVEGYRRVLALRPGDAAAKTNLALCETLLRETGGAPPGHPQQFVLLKALREQKRLLEAAPLAALIDPDIKLAKAALLSRLREARKLPGWTDSKVVPLPDGTFKIDLGNLPPIDFSVLKGQPVSVLVLSSTGITNLSSLAGLPLKDLNLNNNKNLADLSPLRGMSLERLHLSGDSVSDLSPLRGMKLQALILDKGNPVSDLSPLAGMPLALLNCDGCQDVSDISALRGAPLVDLNLHHTRVSSLTPLAGAPLQRLNVTGTTVTDITSLSQCPSLEELFLGGLPITDLAPLAKLHLTSLTFVGTKITSIAPLRGQPLRFLSLGKTGVTDLSPLAGCNTLEEILLPAKAGDLSMLRELPRLKFISTREVGTSGHPAQTAAEFWKEYDAKEATGKK